MSVNLTTIAEKLNISPSTVSRVLNGKAKISEETRRKVLQAAKEMNYIPNSIARKLQQKESKIIGVVVPDITDNFFMNIVKGVEDYLSANDYSMFLCNTGESREKEMHYVNVLYENRVDGIIIATVRNNITQEDRLFFGGIPVVFIDNMPARGNHFNCMTIDNFRAGKMAAEYLIEKGHTKIAAIMGNQEESTGRHRFEGFLKALEEHKLPRCDALYKFCNFKEDTAYRAMNELISAGDFSAIFIASSKMVYGALWAIRQANLSIPEDLSVVGFDLVDPYQLMTPGITSIIQPEHEIGCGAAKQLLQQIQNKDEVLYQHTYKEPELIVRDSVKKVN